MSATPAVFISATTQDLGRYRQAVSRTLVTRQILPVDQEHIAPDFRMIAEILRKRIAECNAVICLVGHVYGREPIDRPSGAPRRSYTQMEYDVAVELGLPIFLFVAADDCPVDAVIEESEELRTLQRDHLKRVTGTDRVWMPFHSVEHLTAQISLMRFDPQSLQAGLTWRLAVILLAELLDTAAQRQRLGEEQWISGLLCPYQELLRQTAARHHGGVQGETPTDCLVNFERADAAVGAAMDLHQAIRGQAWQFEPPNVRIGIHLGQVVQFGGVDESRTLEASMAVEVCRRLVSLAKPGQTLLTKAAFDNARQLVPAQGKGYMAHGADVAAADGSEPPLWSWLSHGRYVPDGPAEPLEVCEVGVPGLAPLRPPAGSAEVHRADSFEERQMRGWRPSLGQSIPRKEDWIIESKLGEGGFGEVWLAQHRRMKQRRVFKFCFDADRLRSFKRELTFFKLIKQHLGDRDDIAQLLDISTDEPPFYLESEYVPAGNLTEWAEQLGGIGRIPLPQRLQLLSEVARAVAAAHSLGIIHKDLKPSNVLIVPREGVPHPRLADFGIGVLADRTILAQDHITETGFTETLLLGNDSSRTGTRLYAPPESLSGKPATTAGDVYALGVMLYQLVIGDLARPLGIGWEDDVADDLLREDIKACTYRDPTRRLASAADLAQRLACLDQRRAERHALQRAEEEARQASAVARQQAERARRLRQWAIAAVATSVVVAGLAALSVAEWRLADRNATRADENAEKAVANAKRADDRAAEAQKYAREVLAEKSRTEAELQRVRIARYASQISLAHRHLLDSDPVAAQQILSACALELRGWEYKHVWTQARSRVRLLTGQGGAVWSICYTPDGRRIVLGSNDATVKVWDLQSGQEVLTLRGHAGHVWSVALSPDGQRIVSGGADGTIRVWNSQSGQVILTIKGGTGDVSSVAFSPDGQRIASTMGATVRIWDARNGEPTVALHGHTGLVENVAFSPDGQWIASGSCDQTTRIWDARSGRLARTLEGSVGAVESVAFRPDGREIVAGSEDGTLTVWDMRTGKAVLTCGRRTASRTTRVCRTAFSPDGRQIASATWDSLRLWDARSGRELPILGQMNRSYCVAFGPDGGQIAAAGWDGTVAVWNTQSVPEFLTLKGHDAGTTSVAFSPDGQRVASASSDETLKIWDLQSGQTSLTLKGHKGEVLSVAFSPDGRRIVSGSVDETLKVWDSRNGRLIRTITGHTSRVPAVAFSPDGRRIVSGSWDNTLKVWDAESGREILTLTGHKSAVGAAAFAPDGRRIVSGSWDKTLKVWDARDGREILTLRGHPDSVWTIALSRDGRRVVSGDCGGAIKLWNAQTGEPLRTLVGHTEPVASVAFSPDGRRIVSGSWDSTMKVWDAESGQELLTINGHASEAVLCVAFSPDGRRIVSGSDDSTLKIWDTSASEKPKSAP